MISILIPTLGRPGRCRDAAHSALDLASRPDDVEVLVRVCDTDATRLEYTGFQPRVTVHELGGCLSYARGIEALQVRAHGDILFCGSDDSLFRTPGWDDIVRATFAEVPDGLLVAYANNGMNREKCEQFFTTRRWIEVVGYLMWFEFRHFCVDQWVEEIAASVGRLKFLREVTVEHMHKKYGKAPDDATYQMVRGNSGVNDADNALFRLRAPAREAAVERLRAVLS